MKNFLLKSLYGALGTLLVAIGQVLTGQAPDHSAVSALSSAGLIGVATGAVAVGKRLVIKKGGTK